MLFKTDCDPTQRKQIDALMASLNHPSHGVLLRNPIMIPQGLLSKWADMACEIAEELTKKKHHNTSPISKKHDFPDCMAMDFAISGTLDAPELKLIETQAYPGTFHLSLAIEKAFGGTVIQGKETSIREAKLNRRLTGGQEGKHVVMLSQTLSPMRSCSDFISAAMTGTVTPTLLSEVYEHNGAWWHLIGGIPTKITHIYARIIYHKLNNNERDILHRMLNSSALTWFNEPAWFYLISKNSLDKLSHPCNPAVRSIHDVDEQLDLSKWVLKHADGHSGEGIMIAPSYLDVRRADPAKAFLQECVNYLPCIVHPAGGEHPPLTGELRFILIRDHDTGQWDVITTLIRTSKDGNISRAMSSDDPYEGATVVLSEQV